MAQAVDVGGAAMTRIEIIEEQYVRTILPDGAEVVAAPTADAESVARARALGYAGSDTEAVWEMTRAHDPLHTLLAEALGYRESAVMRYAAEGLSPSSSMMREVMDREERIVLLMQRLLTEGLDALLAEREVWQCPA